MFSDVCLLLSDANMHNFPRFFSCVIGGIEISELAKNALFINCHVV